MPETIIESALKGTLSHEVLLKWLNHETIEDTSDHCVLLCCTRSEFAAYFLSFLRNQTSCILQSNSTALSVIQHHGTPEKILSSRRKHRRSTSDPTSEIDTDRNTDSLTVKTDRQQSHGSPNRDRTVQKKTGRRVKTKLFNDSDKSKDQNSSFLSSRTDSDESKLSVGVERLVLSSTPLKNGTKPSEYPNLPLSSPVTPHSRSFGNTERCDTPRVNQRHSKSHEKSSFGDFLVNASTGKSSKKKRSTSKNVSNEAEAVSKGSLDFSSSEMFPEIGARKSSSLRSEKRRIKPTNIDTTPQKSFSLNSFNSESFQQPSPLVLEENLAFKHQKLQPKELGDSFEAERSILKQERHKLMEKFNILNTSNSQKTQTPQITVARKESTGKQQSCVQADLGQVKLREKIDQLIQIYDVLLKNNLILSSTNEIYFLISILLSQQSEDDVLSADSSLNEGNIQYILKSIHNCTYFAVKSLWNQKSILEFILEKNSLKILGENKKVRSFSPELAKFLLNLYGIKSESEIKSKEDKVIVLENRFTNGMVCFNFETDNAENFPSILSFQNFKKQRDMFYEILRWYTDGQQSGIAKSTFRTRVKTLLSLAVSPSNHAHLARLYTAHMLAECLPSTLQESKLSKLQRRLTGPSIVESRRARTFTTKEIFYKEFVMFAESESFRVHLRDSLCAEILALDSTSVGGGDDRGSLNADISKEYLQVLKKLRLLSKFLGFLTALPYTQIPIEYTIKTGSVNAPQREANFVPPKEKVFENDISMRNHSQPTIDLKTMLIEANQNCRLTITLPWIVQYLSMLDYTTLRVKYYQELLRYLFEIYAQKLKISNETPMKRNTIIFLNLTVGLLCDLPHFPQELFYEKTPNESNMAANVASDETKMAASVASDENIDSLEVFDEAALFDLCPFLKDINVLLLTSKPTADVKDVGSFRHITPVTVSLNPEDRLRNKEREIQARLEEEFLKGQPSSTRRVLDVVTERVTSSCVRHVRGACVRDARARCVRDVTLLLRGYTGTQAELLPSVREVYAAQLVKLRAAALDVAGGMVSQRVGMALQALVSCGSSKKALTAVVTRACMNRINKWIQEHWNTTEVLCKNIADELQNLQVLGESVLAAGEAKGEVSRGGDALQGGDETHVSPTAALLDIKELICVTLEGTLPHAADTSRVLRDCRHACRRDNVFTRAPAQRALLHLTLDLCLVYVSRIPSEVTESFLSELDAVWRECCPERPDRPERAPELDLVPERRQELSPVFRNFESDERIATPISDEETDTNDANSGQTVISTDQNPPTVTKIIDSNVVIVNSNPDIGKSNPGILNSNPVIVNSNPAIVNSDPILGSSNIAIVNSDPFLVNSNLAIANSIPAIVNSSPVLVNSNPAIVNSNPVLVNSNPAIVNSNPIPKSPIADAKDDGSEMLEYFDRVLCPRNIVLLSDSKCEASEVWEAMATVLVFLLKNRYLTEDSLTEQCLAVYRQDWPQNVLESLSTCMRSVSTRWRPAAGKFTLFLDFLAEFCGDMDFDTFDVN